MNKIIFVKKLDYFVIFITIGDDVAQQSQVHKCHKIGSVPACHSWDLKMKIFSSKP